MDPVPIELILREPSLWGASLAHFCGNFVLYFNTTWIPYFLVHERGWTLPEMATIGGAAYLANGTSAILTGWFSDRFIRSGGSPTIVRKWCWGVGGLGLAACLLGVGYSTGIASVVWLIVGGMFNGTLGLNTYVVAQTMGGPAATGRWVGIQNFIANIAGLIAPAMTGILVQATGSFKLPFTIEAVAALTAAAAWVFLTGPLVRIDWAARGRELVAVPTAADT
jgi:MFS transporter, ACS family, D-galactonate transporter